ncbi:MAG TPA: glycosyl hydrolase, partial [Acidobacteriota bacterium]|nr:glycosyl hydrolase [Acidobacteriota bacterium]
ISSIGSLAIAPSDPNVIYVGSGEANIRGNVGAGNGIYKSVDGGKTWTHVWIQEGQIGAMVVHPTNPDIAFAAVLGHAFGPNSERGVYRTRDGGKTWQQVLKKDADTGASDVAMDPSNPNILFAGLWQTRRLPWTMTSGGPGSGMYMSRDGGDNWKQLTGKGLPDAPWGKVGVRVAPSDGSRIYALIEAKDGGLFRSDDGGDNWTRVSASRLLRQRPWYYSCLTIHPKNPNEVWFPQVPMLKTIDGGQTIQFVDGAHHGDHHDVWIDPVNPKRMIGSNDGGVDISYDGGQTWYAPSLPIAQFYHVSADNRVPFHVAGAMQDIGTAQGPSRSITTSRGIRTGEWYSVGGGEAGHVVSDWSDPNIVYAGEYGGYISRYDHRTQQARMVGIYPDNASGHGGEDLKYRFQWTAPIATSPHDAKVVYHGGNILFRTSDGGQTWAAISPDLTRNDKSKETWAGGPITGDNTGVEIYCTIFAVAESPVQKDLIWAGSDDGLVHVTKDGGKTWKDVTSAMPAFPEWGTVTTIEPSHFDAGTAYVTVDAHRLDNMKPYLYKTTDLGATWSRLDSGLPQDVYLHSVREDTVRKDMLYAGTERGLAYSIDAGKTWRPLKLNFPTVAVHDLVVKDNSLVLATMGRSLWIFDHLSLLREYASSTSSEPAQLFSAPPTIRWQFGYAQADKWSGENPPYGVAFYYRLKDAVKDDLTVEILDSQKNVVQTLSSKPKPLIQAGDNAKAEEEAKKKEALSKEAGIQMGVWNLSSAAPELIPNAKMDTGDPGDGPLVPPGDYTIRLTVAGKTYTTDTKVLPDPRVQMSDVDLRQQYAFALGVREDISRLSRMMNQLRSVRKQLATRNDLLHGNSKTDQLVKDSNALLDKLNTLEAKVHNPAAEVVYDILAFQGGAKLYSRLSLLYLYITGADGVPTQGMREMATAEKAELDGYENQWKQLSAEIGTLNDSARK